MYIMKVLKISVWLVEVVKLYIILKRKLIVK